MLNNKFYVLKAIITALIIIVLAGCDSPPPSNQQMKVQLMWQDNKLKCDTTFIVGVENKTWFIEQFQFFISDIQFGSENSGWHDVTLIENPYQTGNTVLLGRNCRETSQEINTDNSKNWTVEFEPNESITQPSAIRFTLGLPFEVNHLNPISQKSPLNLPSMFWVWQTGHKFMRLELASNNQQWLFHLGSTGCSSASVLRSPTQACRYPNTINVELPILKQQNTNLLLGLDLSALLSGISLTPTSNCQSEQDNESCTQLLKNLLSATDSNEQEAPAVFRIIEPKSIRKGLPIE